MIANLHFFLPEENEEFNIAVNAGKYHSCLWDMMGYLRSNLKHGDFSEVEFDMIESIQERFYEILSDNDVILG